MRGRNHARLFGLRFGQKIAFQHITHYRIPARRWHKVAQVLADATLSALLRRDLLLKPLAFGDVHAPLSPSSASHRWQSSNLHATCPLVEQVAGFALS
jgi:hypothetical protein